LGNITFGVSHQDWRELALGHGVEARAWDAITKAGLDFGGRLTHGLHTKLGYKGMRLSGGQQARLLIAAAHFKLSSHLNRPRLILADEPTASLDSLAETEVLKHINESLPPGTTLLMIAHRLSTVATMDRIMFVRPLEHCGAGEAQITMHTSLAELYQISSLFRKMADAQSFRPV
jgi:ABC-type multidrug transport system fused ATPase/permease subunit